MEIADHIEALRAEGALLAEVATRLDAGTPIPTCPEWRLRDLLLHLGGVHRWAAAHVEERLQHRRSRAETRDMNTGMDMPGDDVLVDWFSAGHTALVRTLETADPDLVCWTFLPAPSALAFWARRQAHETAVHRADAQSVSGVFTPLPPERAVDGIDELLFGMLRTRSLPPRTGTPRLIQFQATDAARQWHVLLRPESIEVLPEPTGGDRACLVTGPASDLFLLLWNRRSAEGLDVEGDAALLDQWREQARV